MFCKNCGNELKDNEKFCSKCGCSVTELETTSNNRVEIKTTTNNTNTINQSTSTKSGLATASMVLGIIAIIFCYIPYLNTISIILGIISIIFVIVVFSKKLKNGQAVAGLVLSIISLAMALFINMVFSMANDYMNNASKELLGNSYYTNK